jgi:hypothetical protein
MGAEGNFKDAADGWSILRFEIDGLLAALKERVGGQRPDQARNEHNI